MLKTNLYLIPEGCITCLSGIPEKAQIAIFLSREDDCPETQKMLRQILSAVNVDMETDCVICTLSPDAQAHYYNAISNGNVSKILVFGLSADNLSLHIKPGKYSRVFLDQIEWIFSDSLTKILEEKARGEKRLRIALWNALKPLFKIGNP